MDKRYLKCACDGCGAKVDAEVVDNFHLRFPKSWGVYTVDGKSFQLCRRCNENFKRYGSLKVGGKIVDGVKYNG